MAAPAPPPAEALPAAAAGSWARGHRGLRPARTQGRAGERLPGPGRAEPSVAGSRRAAAARGARLGPDGSFSAGPEPGGAGAAGGASPGSRAAPALRGRAGPGGGGGRAGRAARAAAAGGLKMAGEEWEPRRRTKAPQPAARHRARGPALRPRPALGPAAPPGPGSPRAAGLPVPGTRGLSLGTAWQEAARAPRLVPSACPWLPPGPWASPAQAAPRGRGRGARGGGPCTPASACHRHPRLQLSRKVPQHCSPDNVNVRTVLGQQGAAGRRAPRGRGTRPPTASGVLQHRAVTTPHTTLSRWHRRSRCSNPDCKPSAGTRHFQCASAKLACVLKCSGHRKVGCRSGVGSMPTGGGGTGLPSASVPDIMEDCTVKTGLRGVGRAPLPRQHRHRPREG
ncbi:uncharacterized protein LOC142418321 isoform X2 [Mycteria americana]|uniref:uncharacterized protein LOC142418321 isoform X2 n=1 Tax=Mycteria americana TaxID=33587 RepID=UPI003F588F66